MYSLRTNSEFCFSEEEEQRMERPAEEIISILTKNNLTYIQAEEVLEMCKVKLKELVISR